VYGPAGDGQDHDTYHQHRHLQRRLQKPQAHDQGRCPRRWVREAPPVKASESAAAPTRASVTASARIGARMAEIMECRSFRTLARLDALEGAFTQVGGVEGRPISL
jgi:hypothetical protein